MKMRRILLLNSSYQPVSFVGERKALSLVLRNVVDIVSTWDGETLMPKYGPENKPVPMPATLRLTEWHNRKVRMPKFRRHVVFARDNYKCQYCFKSLSAREATIDHVIPKSLGGELSWKNAVTACRPCNRFKDNCTPEQAGMRLIVPPVTPTVAHFWDMRHTDENWHESWTMFLPK